MSASLYTATLPSAVAVSSRGSYSGLRIEMYVMLHDPRGWDLAVVRSSCCLTVNLFTAGPVIFLTVTKPLESAR